MAERESKHQGSRNKSLVGERHLCNPSLDLASSRAVSSYTSASYSAPHPRVRSSQEPTGSIARPWGFCLIAGSSSWSTTSQQVQKPPLSSKDMPTCLINFRSISRARHLDQPRVQCQGRTRAELVRPSPSPPTLRRPSSMKLRVTTLIALLPWTGASPFSQRDLPAPASVSTAQSYLAQRKTTAFFAELRRC